LADFRQAAKLTQWELAANVNFDRTYVSKAESGRCFPRGQDPRPLAIAAAPGPAFRTLVEAAFEVGCAWTRDQDWEHMQEFRQQTREQRLLVNRIMESVEQSLGRKASPFRLRLTILPVEGLWAYRPTDGQVLMSKATRNNPDELTRLLDPIFRELA
jgi:transcriptional regulator with XRE-family HTH domain